MTVEIRSCFFSLYVSWIFHILRFNIEDILSETERRGERRGQPLFYFCVIFILYVHGHWVDLCDHYRAVCLKMVAARKNNGHTNSGI
jgi:hypothetical protein